MKIDKMRVLTHDDMNDLQVIMTYAGNIKARLLERATIAQSMEHTKMHKKLKDVAHYMEVIESEVYKATLQEIVNK